MHSNWVPTISRDSLQKVDFLLAHVYILCYLLRLSLDSGQLRVFKTLKLASDSGQADSGVARNLR